MFTTLRVVLGSFVLGMFMVGFSGCVVEPHEGYWDHGNHRYYHEHHWHDCGEPGNICR